MEIYLIEGPENIGKSSLIYAQYIRCMKTGNFKEIYSDLPNSLDDFIFVLENLSTGEYILFNSPTDERSCIVRFNKIINQYNNSNLTKIVTSIRDMNNNPKLHKWTMDVIKNHYPNATIYTIDLNDLASI